MKTPFILLRAALALMPFLSLTFMLWYFKKKKSRCCGELADFYTSYHLS